MLQGAALTQPQPRAQLSHFSRGSERSSPSSRQQPAPCPTLSGLRLCRAEIESAASHGCTACAFYARGRAGRCVSLFGVAARGYVMLSAAGSDLTHRTCGSFVVLPLLPFSPSLLLPGGNAASQLAAFPWLQSVAAARLEKLHRAINRPCPDLNSSLPSAPLPSSGHAMLPVSRFWLVL